MTEIATLLDYELRAAGWSALQFAAVLQSKGWPGATRQQVTAWARGTEAIPQARLGLVLDALGIAGRRREAWVRAAGYGPALDAAADTTTKEVRDGQEEG